MTTLYTADPIGYPGNDDLGEMSSWYVFGALGMYPELPGSDILVTGSPMFPKAVVHLGDRDITIIGNGAAVDAPYVQNLTINGKTWEKPWFRFTDICENGKLVYDLSSTPNTNWGSDPADAPPSYDAPAK
jgi:putative alpha-1,2-mannosidase